MSPRLLLRPYTITPMTGRSYPALKMQLRVERRPAYYAFNVGLPMATLSLMASLIFLVPLDEGGVRLDLAFALMLTCVTYKSGVISHVLPAVAYLTMLDRYIFAAVGIVVLNTFDAAVVSAIVATDHWTGEGRRVGLDTAQFADRACFCVSILLWVGLHLYYSIKVYVMLRPRRSERGSNTELSSRVSAVDDLLSQERSTRVCDPSRRMSERSERSEKSGLRRKSRGFQARAAQLGAQLGACSSRETPRGTRPAACPAADEAAADDG